jgi:Chaperone of endosialidase
MTVDRRRILQVALGGGSLSPLVLPERWVKPVIKSVIVPAHAAASPATTTTPAPTTTREASSDIRLKRDIVVVGRLENGIRLCRYRYIWGDQVYVGVMAQEVAEIVPDAVVYGDDGYLSVDYARLGRRLITWDEWVAACQPSALQAESGAHELHRHAGA